MQEGANEQSAPQKKQYRLKKLFQKRSNIKKSLIAAGILGAILTLHITIIAPQLTKLPTDFNYKASIISLDNFFDETTNEYTGNQRTVSQLQLTSTQEQDGSINILNTFDVRTVDGEAIISLSRNYSIDRVSRKHNDKLTENSRTGYLFAPTFVSKNDEFTYWHINYDAPAQMKFVEEENILGLTTYHFHSEYTGQIIDQTQSLTNLPGVPEERGIRLEPVLDIWVEPTTGQLIKYEDETIAYYYDQDTDELLNPWNKFSNRLDRASIVNNVNNASAEKIRMRVIHILIPAIIVIIIAGILVGMLSAAGGKLTIVFFTTIAGVSAFTAYQPQPQEIQYKVGIASWTEGASFQSNVDAFKETLNKAGFIEGENIEYDVRPSNTNIDTQTEIITTFKANNVDLIYTLATGGTLVAKDLVTDIPVVFSIVSHPVESGIIESLKSSGNNFTGSRNWISYEAQLDNMLTINPGIDEIAFIYKSEPNAEYQLQELTQTAQRRGINIEPITIESLSDIRTAISQTTAEKNIDALFAACDSLRPSGSNKIIAEIAIEQNLPPFGCAEPGAQEGLLLVTSPNIAELGTLAGQKAALILNGIEPSTIETSALTTPTVSVNQTTAQKLGIEIPQSLLSKTNNIYTTAE